MRSMGQGAPLDAYLGIVYDYYMGDRLDAAMTVATDAFKHTGWPPGPWTGLYNELTCEKAVRDVGAVHRVDDKLSIELVRYETSALLSRVIAAAVEARAMMRHLLGTTNLRPVLLTVFAPGAPVQFIPGPHGYVMHKYQLDKICLPHHAAANNRQLAPAVRHEFAHVASCELAAGQPPAWLDEGLATYLSGDLKHQHSQSAIGEAAQNRQNLRLSKIQEALDLRELTEEDADRVGTAYSLAGSFVEWWAGRNGLSTIRDTLLHLGQGESLVKSVKIATGVSLRSLEHGWSDCISPPVTRG